MVFEFYFVAATVGAFIVSGLRHHGVSTTHTVNNSLARTDLIYVYNDLKRIVERYSDPEIEEELEKM